MTDGADVSEQWLLDGDCRICRRKRYCTKGCKKNRIARDRLLDALLMSAILKRMNRREEADDADELQMHP